MNLIIMILLISLLILVHEAGHFFAAKLMKMKVDKFGFGLPIGPTLFKKKFGETEFLIHAFLLGGYVAFPDDDEKSELPKDSPLRFSNKKVGERIFVIVAGVVANVICAYILVALAATIWGHLPANSYDLRFSKFLPSATDSMLNSGIQKGDTFYSINGVKIIYPTIFTKFTSLSSAYDGLVEESLINKKAEDIKRLNPDIKDFNNIPANTKIILPEAQDENPVKLTQDQAIGFEKYQIQELQLNDFQKDLRDKLKDKKEYITPENLSISDLSIALSDTRKPIYITVKRDNKEIQLNPIYADEEGKIGIEQILAENIVETKNIVQIAKETSNYINYNTNMMIYGLGKLFAGKVPMQEMRGIVAITKIGSDVIKAQGLYKGLLLTAIISLNLAIINILPIPALDGGHLFFLIVEKVTGKPVDKKFVDKTSNFFFYLLIILMVVIVYNDIIALITKQI